MDIEVAESFETTEDIFQDIEEFSSIISADNWQGTMEDYISMVQKNPKLSQLSHARILDMIESAGVEYSEGDKFQSLPKYKFFSNDLYGVNESIHKVVNYLKAAASGSQVGRRILLLYGPTSSGKSQMATLIKNGLEDWTKTKEGAVYALKDSPMHENPLNAVPMGLRKVFREKYNIKIDPSARLSPLMQWKLENEYENNWLKLPVHRVFFSEASRVGIGTFLPSDQKSQSISELVGSVDFSKLGEYGVESDPRAYVFNGELNVSNRGLIEMIEMLKVDPKFLYVLLTLAQEKMIKTERFPLIYSDQFLLAHSNETEYNRFIGDTKMEALHDRMIVVRCPYNLVVGEEEKIYSKLIAEADFGNIHIAPLTLKIASMFAVLSRLEESPMQNLTLMKKMQLYNKEDVEGFTYADIKKIKEETEREGMDGISPRYIFNCIADCFTKQNLTCITPVDIIRAIKNNFESNPKLTKDHIKKYDEILVSVIDEYNHMARCEVQKAFFVDFEVEIENLLNNYVDNIGAYLDKTKVEDEFGEMHEPNIRLMREIEEHAGVGKSHEDSFRQEVYRKVIRSRNRGDNFSYTAHVRLKTALEKQMFNERADTIRLTISASNPDPESLEKLNFVVKTLVDRYDYNHESANQLLRYVSSIMGRS